MITLPDFAIPNGCEAALMDFGGFLQPGLGGAVQRIDRMGNRFTISVTFPPMPSKDKGRILVSRLLRGKTEGVRMEYPLLSFRPGSPGNILVNGAGQAGRTLTVDGATPHYAFREGQPFSIEVGGQHYLHFVDAEVIANASGQATLSVTPMLRVEPTDNAPCHFAKPMIEGFVMGEEYRWAMSLDHNIDLTVDIMERG